MKHLNLSFAGAGRVAGALCMKMHYSGYRIIQIVSNSESDGKPLAISCNAAWSSDLSFTAESEIIIVAVPDHKLEEVLSRIKCSENSIVAHTAGSFGLELFPGKIKRKGVFYPLQTFSRGRETDFNQLPFLIEASDEGSAELLGSLAEQIGGRSYFVDSESRRIVHLSAVFVNNFTNFMLTAGKDISSKAELPFSILEPLIKETISKALDNGPEISQTGPAIRNDQNTIEKHLELLSFSPDLQNLYSEVTKAIINHYKKV
jgi:predicted short-subunit dehydrogenase-like oxidoreductase (DUF2520 family)